MTTDSFFLQRNMNDARDSAEAKKARLAKQKALREKRMQRVLSGGEDRLAVVSGEKDTSVLKPEAVKKVNPAPPRPPVHHLTLAAPCSGVVVEVDTLGRGQP
jgi:hypothetical protein